MTRSCGSCTKCCEGFLRAEVKGPRGFTMGEIKDGDVHNPKPCPFVIKGKGCKQYLIRPKDPCKIFKCEWLINEDMPDNMRPDLSDSITIQQTTPNGIPYLFLTDAGRQLDSRVLSWHIIYAMNKGFNFAWKINGAVDYIGRPDFCQAMEKHVAANQEIITN